MSSEIEYIEPTQEHVGQMVEVRDNDGQDWRKRKLLGVISHRLRFITEPEFDGIPLPWRYARIPRPLTYAERQAKCGLNVGDRVKIVRAFKDYEDGFGNTMEASMHLDVGSVQYISSVYSHGMRFESIGYTWPYFVLEKIEDREPTPSDIGKTVYVVGNPQEEFTLDLAYCVLQYRGGIIRRGDKRFVYELSNLRVKE